MINDSPLNTEDFRFRSPLLKPKGAADYLNISVSGLNKLRRQGKIAAVYLDSDARYRIEDLDAFISRCDTR